MRIALGIEYDGHEFYGWQAQKNLITLQGLIESALGKIANAPINVICAGRTDTGVHATGQVIHFDTEAKRPIKAWTLGTNTHLPRTIAVRWGSEVDPQFHARFSALRRRYRYIIYNHPVRSAILAARATWHYTPLNEGRMQEAANYLLGEQDFSAFRSSQCQSKTAVRTVHSILINRQGSYVTIEIEASAFLHHMVRNITGALMRVGEGDEEPQWVKSLLDAKDRRLAPKTAAPTGLYLTHVTYPKPYIFPMGEPYLTV